LYVASQRKPITLRARHSGGVVLVTVADDGVGVDLDLDLDGALGHQAMCKTALHDCGRSGIQRRVRNAEGGSRARCRVRDLAAVAARGRGASPRWTATGHTLNMETMIAKPGVPDLTDWPSDDLPIMVLLVDDQAIIGEAVRRILAAVPNVDFHYCASGDQAVRVAEKTRPTVILQDLVMPGIDGLELVRQYRAHPALKNIPIVVLSTKDEAEIKRAAFTAGANDYLVKLPDSIELIARIRYHSGSYQNLLQRDEAFRALRQSQQQLLETNLELLRLTNSDGLTGLSNRRYFDEYVGAEWRRAAREQTRLGLLMIDVDHFKSYNDQYGHVPGDDVLKLVASTINNNACRPGDLAVRFGGDEFALVLPVTSSDGVRVLGEKVRMQIETLAIARDGLSGTNVLTLSVGGAAIVPLAGEPVTKLIMAADLALYRAKHNGRNRMVIGN
jgi:two-component system chemotaxis family response regulator WspR